MYSDANVCVGRKAQIFIVNHHWVTKMQKQAELYRGKAKTVYSTENPDLLILEFRNDTSAGDGARIEQFDRKGMVNNKFNHFIMSKLAEAGIPTQMEALLSDTECLVKKAGYGAGGVRGAQPRCRFAGETLGLKRASS